MKLFTKFRLQLTSGGRVSDPSLLVPCRVRKTMMESAFLENGHHVHTTMHFLTCFRTNGFRKPKVGGLTGAQERRRPGYPASNSLHTALVVVVLRHTVATIPRQVLNIHII